MPVVIVILAIHFHRKRGVHDRTGNVVLGVTRPPLPCAPAHRSTTDFRLPSRGFHRKRGVLDREQDTRTLTPTPSGAVLDLVEATIADAEPP